MARSPLACSAIASTTSASSYLSKRTLEVVAATVRMSEQLGAERADLCMLMRVLAAEGYLPSYFTAPWSVDERALVSGILDPQPVAVKPMRRSWGPELAVRELRRELEVTLGARTVGASEVGRLFRSIGDDVPGFDVTASAGRVDLRRDGRTITLEWLADEITSRSRFTAPATPEPAPTHGAAKSPPSSTQRATSSSARFARRCSISPCRRLMRRPPACVRSIEV